MLTKPEALKEVFKKRIRKCIQLCRLPVGAQNELCCGFLCLFGCCCLVGWLVGLFWKELVLLAFIM